MQPTEKDFAKAKKLLRQGYYQISRAYRMLARLPIGESPNEALARCAVKHMFEGDKWAHRLPPGHAGDSYLRDYAREEGNVIEVSEEVFRAFRQLGGDTYLSKHWGDKKKDERKASKEC